MSNIFDLFYNKTVEWKAFQDGDNTNVESGYLPGVDSMCIRFGQSRYNRDTYSYDNIKANKYQTNDNVKIQDKYDGHIVTDVDDLDFMGIKFKIVTVNN